MEKFWLFVVLQLLPLSIVGRRTPNIGYDGGEGYLSLSLSHDEEAILETFKYNLIRYYGVSESFAEQFKKNLLRAIDEYLKTAGAVSNGQLQGQSPGQARQSEDEEEDDEETTPATTLGPSPLNIVNGVYGILSGLGTLNPDRIFQSTVNFFPPSQKGTAQALIESALGQKPGTWPTTTPTTTKLTTSTKDPDDEDDEDEDATSTVNPVVVVAAAAVPTGIIAVAPATATIAPPIEKYTIGTKETATVVTSGTNVGISAVPKK